MKSRMVQVLIVVALLVPFAGCPVSPAIRLGEWEFEIDQDGTLYPVILRFNGEAESPAGTGAVFFGTLTWSQDETGFRLTQLISDSESVYISTTLTRTAMEGIITGPNLGTWTARFVE